MKIRLTLLALALTCTSAHGAPPAVKQVKKLPELRDKWAVLVGVPVYNDTSIEPLKYANKNVLNMMNTLCDPEAGRFAKDHVMIVAGAKATRSNLIKATYDDWLSHKALPDHLITLYMSARAMPTDDKSDILVFPVDTVLAQKDSTAVSLKSLLSELKRRTQSKNIVCMLDLVTVKGEGTGGALKQVADFTGVTILSSDDSLKQSADSTSQASSAWVQYFSDGVKAGGGYMPIETVNGFIGESMLKSAPGQKPTIYVAKDNPDIAKQAFGVKIKLPFDPKNVKIGHPLDTLPVKRPDLAVGLSENLKTPVKEKPLVMKDDDDDKDDDVDYTNLNLDDYMSVMKKTIQAKWAPPRDMVAKTIVAVFCIQRDGRITDAEIIEGSGKADIDKTAMDALKNASLPPLPKGAPKYLQVRYKFDYKVSSH